MDEDTNINTEEKGEEIDKVKAERDEYLSGWQRAKADFLNYKKDEAKRMEEIAKYQLEDVLYDLLTVLDNFTLAITALEKQGAAEKGVYMIKTQLEDVLRKRGLEKIQISEGSIFDPSVAEAIAEVDSEKEGGAIVEIIEAGYRINGKLLRPARVKISKGQKE